MKKLLFIISVMFFYGCNTNSDYEAKRYNNMTLKPLRLHKARKGLFYKWLSQKGKLGGQHKVPRLSNSREILDELLKMNY